MNSTAGGTAPFHIPPAPWDSLVPMSLLYAEGVFGFWQ